MFGLFIFVMTVVLGALGLLWGLRMLGVIEGDRPGTPEGGVSRVELERVQDALGALESRLDALQDQQLFLERLLAGREGPRALPGERGPGAGGEAGGGGGAGGRAGAEPAGESDSAASILFDTGREERS